MNQATHRAPSGQHLAARRRALAEVFHALSAAARADVRRVAGRVASELGFTSLVLMPYALGEHLAVLPAGMPPWAIGECTADEVLDYIERCEREIRDWDAGRAPTAPVAAGVTMWCAQNAKSWQGTPPRVAHRRDPRRRQGHARGRARHRVRRTRTRVGDNDPSPEWGKGGRCAPPSTRTGHLQHSDFAVVTRAWQRGRFLAHTLPQTEVQWPLIAQCSCGARGHG